MSSVKRVYVEKKPEYAVAAKELRHEIRHYLGIADTEEVRVLIRYDVENISDDTFEKACRGVFAEPPVDILYRDAALDCEYFLWNFFRDSLISGLIRRSSAYVLLKRMKNR